MNDIKIDVIISAGQYRILISIIERELDLVEQKLGQTNVNKIEHKSLVTRRSRLYGLYYKLTEEEGD